jgi:hypothetical protein
MRRSRGVWTAWAVALLGVGLLADPAAGAADPEAKAARRRWALAKMDEMANERLRCRERFQKRREVERCEADYARRFREYNQMYLEAARD